MSSALKCCWKCKNYFVTKKTLFRKICERCVFNRMSICPDCDSKECPACNQEEWHCIVCRKYVDPMDQKTHEDMHANEK